MFCQWRHVRRLGTQLRPTSRIAALVLLFSSNPPKFGEAAMLFPFRPTAETCRLRVLPVTAL
jgi:hypothetical protein|eukprot:COSAG01_NODE_1226_length_11140_cov_73.834798_4_plen_62_part_00